MAIQMRRGQFEQFDPSRLLPGEWAVVLSGDSGASDGRTAYICFAAGDVKRVLTDGDADYSLAIDGHTVRLVRGAGDSEVTVPDIDTTYDDATQSVHGLMSAADKKRLDGLTGITWGQL